MTRLDDLQREHSPGDRLQSVGIGGDERVAGANGVDHRHQASEHREIDRDADDAERGNRPHTHDQRAGLRGGRNAKRGHRPLLGRDHPDEHREHDRAVNPVEDDQDAQDNIGDR